MADGVRSDSFVAHLRHTIYGGAGISCHDFVDAEARQWLRATIEEHAFLIVAPGDEAIQCIGCGGPERTDANLAALAVEAVSTEERLQSMRKANPAFIPRNHRVEGAISAAVNRNDFQPFEELLEVLVRPFEERSGFEHYAQPAKADERVLYTFCGT